MALKNPLDCGIIGVLQTNLIPTHQGGNVVLHKYNTTQGATCQAPISVDLKDGKPLGYWVKDEQGRVYHAYTKSELPLVDRSPSGRVRPWRVHHRDGLMLAEVYESMAELTAEQPDSNAAKYLDKARRLTQCASFAEFQRLPSGELRLHDSSFCRVRLCPMCQWRRSLKLGAQVRQVVERANADRIKETGAPLRWLMVTLTVRNVEGPDLGREIDRLHKAINNMAKCKTWSAAVLGWLRATEVTHNTKADTYHPHIHLLLCVSPSYFRGRNYITQKGWQTMWAHYAGTDYEPVVDVRAVKPVDGARLSDLPAGEQAAAMGKACAEVSKYAAKPADYIIPQDWAASMQAVAVLDSMLDKRRMTSWGGVLKKIAKGLQLDDPENGDLVHIDETASADQTAEELAHYVAYSWAMGARDYLPTYERDGAAPAAERAEREAVKAGVSKGRRAASADDLATVAATPKRDGYYLKIKLAQMENDKAHKELFGEAIPRPVAVSDDWADMIFRGDEDG